ncbi:MAG: LysE family transporter [Bacteroidetes bacterium]|nr:LysE family transporter [Bacteroidota bacterium]
MKEFLPLIGTVALLNLFAAISPGPDFVMAVRNSVTYSRKTGIFTGIGIGLGISIHILYCAAGVGYIISKSILVFTIIKYLGAIYLIYMGIMAIVSKTTKIEIDEETKLQDLTRFQAIKTGFLTNVLNPKATLFFLGLFTFVVKPHTPISILVILSLIMILTAIGWFTIVALFFTHKKIRSSFTRFEQYFNKFFGGLLILLGIKIALTK